jgi:hypothetical protein
MLTPPSSSSRNSVVDLVVQRVLTGTLLALAASLIAVALHLA